MRKVYFVYMLRKATSPIALQSYIFAFFIWQLALVVSMPHIFSNMPSILSPREFISFHAASFLNTEPLVQILAIGTIVLLIWLARNIVRNLKNSTGALMASIGIRS